MHADTLLLRGTETGRKELVTLSRWYPVTLDAAALTVGWRHMGERPFTAPFFHDSLLAQPMTERRVCRTSVAELGDWPDTVPPTAFIFHVSRCGSTLLTQMLATLPTAIVMSEPPVLDAFFRLHHRHSMHSGGAETLRRLIAALGQRRNGLEKHFFVKFDSWHTPWMPLLREVFPATPMVFLYRQPAQVLASHQRSRGPQMVPGLLDTSRLRVNRSGLTPGDLDGYAGRVLGAIFKAALDEMSVTSPILLNYRQLPTAIWTDLLPTLGIQLTPSGLNALQARGAFHSKHTGALFTGDEPPAGDGAGCTPAHALASRCFQSLEIQRTAAQENSTS